MIQEGELDVLGRKKAILKIRPSQAGKGAQTRERTIGQQSKNSNNLTTLLQQIRPDLATVDKT